MHDRNSVPMHSVTVAVSVGEDFHCNSYTEHERNKKIKEEHKFQTRCTPCSSLCTQVRKRVRKHGLIRALAGASACGSQIAMVSRLA